MTGLLSGAAVADTAPATGPVADRVKAVAAWKAGGPVVRRAAETALTGSDGDVTAFVNGGRTVAEEQDLRARLEQLLADAGPGVREVGLKALGPTGSIAEVRSVLDGGARKQYEDDQRVRLSQIMADGGPGVKAAAGAALDGTIDDVNRFLNVGQFKARDDDDRVRLSQVMATGGPEVKKAAGAALDGTVDDVRAFLRYGWQTAAAHDRETLTVAQLADVAGNASSRAREQARVAEDAAKKALDATRLAKAAAERAAEETRLAKGEAGKAANAANRAADAANRAANAARTASWAAAAANEAAQQAANAAADAAAASTLAGAAAARARSAAADAATNAGKAGAARDAAVKARQAAADSRTSGEAAAWAGRAALQAGSAAKAASDAGDNAAAAAEAAADAAEQSGVATDAADRARAAADKAKRAAGEARRAAKITVAIAEEAAAAAAEAQRAANRAAGHAEAAAAAADTAAAHAGEAATAANTAQAAATEANAAADTAAAASDQAHKLVELNRRGDAERLAAQTAAEMAIAEDASRAEAEKIKTAAWEAGKNVRLAASTETLLVEATAAGVDPAVAVTKGRQAAAQLLTTGGPWAKGAAETALEGRDSDVLAFLTTNLAQARERDDRVSAMTIAQRSTNLAQRLAAEAASVGTAAEVREFVATGAYPGKDDDDRVLLSQIMAAGGPGVKAAAGKALDGTMADVRAFLAEGQYKEREDDNRVLISQAMAAGGGEVKAAAQAALSGPASGLASFLTIGLPKAQQRDAYTRTHVATVSSYLASIDSSVSHARQYAAQASQSYALARGAQIEASTYANQAEGSAKEAADWAAKAAESARQAKESAAQAAAYAKQALASAASADAAVRRADASASSAARHAEQAKQYASDAKKASDEAKASAVEAKKSAEEADQAAKDAAAEVWKKQQSEAAGGQTESETAVVDENGRVSFIQVVPRPGLKQEIVREDMSKCIADDPGTELGWLLKSGSKTWHKNAAGVEVCNVTVTVKVVGEIDYILKTCPEPNLSIAACQGKYSTWNTLVLSTETVNTEYPTTIELTYTNYAKHYKVSCSQGVCMSGDSSRMLIHMLTDDFVKCFNNFGLNGPCAWAASNFIPYGTLAKGAKGVVAFRFALESGVGIEQAKLALQASLDGYNAATIGRLTAMADAVTSFRLTLRSGVGTDAALTALRNNPHADRALVQQLEIEAQVARDIRTACDTNSFPAGTTVVMADGTNREIETVKVGDRLLAGDPVTGADSVQTVTDTFGHKTTRLFDIDIEGAGRITSTAGHRLYVEGAGWREAATLRVGDVLVSPEGTRHPVTGLGERTGLAPESVFDLTVDGPHTFYVRGPRATGADVLVHNCYNLLRDETAFEQAHTIRDHVAVGPWGPGGTTVGATDAAARQFAVTKGRNGVFLDADIAAAALKDAVSKAGNRMSTFLQPGGSDFLEFKIGVDVLVDGQRLSSLGKVYVKNGPNPADVIVKDAGSEVVVRLVKADAHGGRKWICTSIYPL
ncbi:polymorphic toxin-type HINT domain-containing protein [Streptomyces sp. SBC-4]|nr:polymorphic toxin-type HINT domain-containing protein [Streptomyces sp. SBC-4]MDV5145394.1 polymorphic toxin-type HINT domain-containing protein [Streptomyces sp. SBC-4]